MEITGHEIEEYSNNSINKFKLTHWLITHLNLKRGSDSHLLSISQVELCRNLNAINIQAGGTCQRRLAFLSCTQKQNKYYTLIRKSKRFNAVKFIPSTQYLDQENVCQKQQVVCELVSLLTIYLPNYKGHKLIKIFILV